MKCSYCKEEIDDRAIVNKSHVMCFGCVSILEQIGVPFIVTHEQVVMKYSDPVENIMGAIHEFKKTTCK